MDIDTLLTEHIDLADQKPMYDSICKKILSNKMILAWIMKECAPEYYDIEVEDIAEKYIEGEPDVSTINVATGEMISGLGTEDTGINEGKIVYDIRYRALSPTDEGRIELIINVEAQNQYNPGYPLVKRGIYYGSRMISGQYGADFNKADYHKIKKVYSIWICRNVPKALENSITSYDLKETNHVGMVTEKKANYDLMSIVMVYLGRAAGPQHSRSSLLKMLNVLLSEDVRAKEKLDVLSSEYRIPKAARLEMEVQTMCNLSQGVEDRGIAKGIKIGEEKGLEQGLEKGLEQGLEQGLEKGLEKGITTTVINMMKNLKLSLEDALTAAGIPEAQWSSYAATIGKLKK